jgi:hypothetical protein
MPTIALYSLGLDTSGGSYYPYHDKYEGSVAGSAWGQNPNPWNNLATQSTVYTVTNPELSTMSAAYTSNTYVSYLIGMCSLYDASTLKNDGNVKSVTQSVTQNSAATCAGIINYVMS